MARAGRIGIVGGGLGGLAAACVLAARGYPVTLFERNSWPGGKAAVLQRDGYRFDMGPTILTLPSVLRRIFAEAGKKLEDYLTLVECKPQWRSFFEGGGVLDLVADKAAMKENLEKFAPGSNAAAGYEKFLDFAERLHRISDRFFFWKSIGSLWDMVNWKSLFDPSMLGDVLSMKMGSTVAKVVRQHVPEARVAQMIDHFTQYVGSSPDNSPAVLCGIAHMQTQEGIWYPIGGTGAVPRALAKLAGELGIEIRTETGIKHILRDDASKRVLGVETEAGEKVELAAVVSNADSVRTHRELLAGSPAAKKFEGRRKYEPACSGVVLYLGLKKAYDHVAHHNFVFSRDPHEEFEAIYNKGIPAPDPTCYVCAPSRSEPGVAPEGGEALYILVHTPYLRPGQDWRKMLPEYRQVILNKMKTTAGMPDLEERIVTEGSLTPQDIHNRYGVLDGAIYGLASHGVMFGAFKPANRSPDLQGLYLAGGAAHPGPGMPMVLMSGWIAADTLDKDEAVVRSCPRTVAANGSATNAVSVSVPTAPPTALNRTATPIQKEAKAEGRNVPLPKRVPWRVQFFVPYFRRWMAKNFHAIRLSKTGLPPCTEGKPVLVVLNHPSWWDPLFGMILGDLFPEYAHYAPIEAAALKQYPIFEPMGLFGVENTAEGAIAFLRTSAAILSEANRGMWLTAQGKFADPRERPVTLRPGVGHLLRRLKDVIVLPLAIEYPFWQERFPEALAHFGTPIEVGEGRARSVDQWVEIVQGGLTKAMDDLALVAATQDEARFETLAGGNVGVGGIYDLWRRVKALMGGKTFTPSHRDSLKLSAPPGLGELG
jgi:phytoene desaturase